MKTISERKLKRYGISSTKPVETQIDNYTNAQSIIDDILIFSEKYNVPPINISAVFEETDRYYGDNPIVLILSTMVVKDQTELESELNAKLAQQKELKDKKRAKDLAEYERLKKIFEKG